MVQKKNAKTLALMIAANILTLALIQPCDLQEVGLTCSSPLLSRLAYPLFHASLFHALVNAWCLLSVVFIHNTSFLRLMVAYLCSILAPDWVLTSTPTVGLSCMCFFLLGSIAHQVDKKIYFHCSMIACLGIGFLFPHINTRIHIYGYICGLIISLLNTPLPWHSKNQ